MDKETNIEETDAGEQQIAPPAEAINTEGQPETETTEQEQTIPYSRFKQVNDKYRELEAELERRKKAEEMAEIEAQKQAGKYQELYEKTLTEMEQIKQERQKMEHDMLRREVAANAGYAGLWPRLSGETEEELAEDLKSLLAAMPKAPAPNLDGGSGSNMRKTAEDDSVSESERQRLASIYGIKQNFMPKKKSNFGK